MDDQRDYAEEAANAALMHEEQDEPDVYEIPLAVEKFTYMITVKLPRNPLHDPRKKVQGFCPVNGMRCTNVTGEHHTLLVVSPYDIDKIMFIWQQKHHVTRIEMT